MPAVRRVAILLSELKWSDVQVVHGLVQNLNQTVLKKNMNINSNVNYQREYRESQSFITRKDCKNNLAVNVLLQFSFKIVVVCLCDGNVNEFAQG
jgi:hypothetical protein